MRGIDTAEVGDDTKETVEGQGRASWVWNWRGKGWLMIASSRWETIGYGEEEGNAWVVTYFSKTLFTPAGIDIYSRQPSGLSSTTLESIKSALAKDDGVKKLAGELFTVEIDKT